MTDYLTIRSGLIQDIDFLEQMLYEAFFWNPQQARPEFELFRSESEFKKQLANWGKPGDCSLIAEKDHLPAGAAWYRFWTEENHSYGFISDHIPELGIAVGKAFRSQGIGRALLRNLMKVAKQEGLEALSLSVDPNNYALILYESEGFKKVGESGTSWTLVHYL
jgi:ribosomal protein S18 acetylase RimI-like enzyme